jgi:hypothetical protein
VGGVGVSTGLPVVLAGPEPLPEDTGGRDPPSDPPERIVPTPPPVVDPEPAPPDPDEPDGGGPAGT